MALGLRAEPRKRAPVEANCNSTLAQSLTEPPQKGAIIKKCRRDLTQKVYLEK